MFERFTARSRRVMVLAQEEVRLLRHDWIGTEHLVLALIAEGEGIAAQVLEASGITLVAARARAEEMVGRGESATSGNPPFTPRAKKALALAVRESTQLGHDYIGTEHLLLGIIREGDGVGSRVLRDLGADPAGVRQRVVSRLTGYVPEPEEGAPAASATTRVGAPSPWSRWSAELRHRAGRAAKTLLRRLTSRGS